MNIIYLAIYLASVIYVSKWFVIELINILKYLPTFHLFNFFTFQFYIKAQDKEALPWFDTFTN